MGAWIETGATFVKAKINAVAPCVGAWIETLLVELNPIYKEVAPCVGAWIETCKSTRYVPVESGRTLRGCVD